MAETLLDHAAKPIRDPIAQAEAASPTLTGKIDKTWLRADYATGDGAGLGSRWTSPERRPCGVERLA
jgi:hypothetical protein